MLRKVGLSEIFGSMGVMLGSTGGKGVIISSIEKALAGSGIRLITLSSGGCFRKAQDRDPKLKARMSSGKLIEDLDDIKPEIKTQLREYLTTLIYGGEVFFMGDGVERLGASYIYQEKEGMIGKTAPSQVGQMSKMLWEVLKEISDVEYLSKQLGGDVHALLGGDWNELVFIDEGIPYELRSVYEPYIGQFTGEMTRGEIFTLWYKSSKRFLVNTSLEDSEAFMRVRSSEAIRNLLATKTWMSSTIQDNLVLDILALQEGRFRIVYEMSDGKRKQKIVIDHNHEGRVLKPLAGVGTDVFDREMRTLVGKLNDVANNSCEGDPLLNLQSTLHKLFDERAMPTDNKGEAKGLIAAIRTDDLSLASRRERARVYRKETISLLTDELGYRRLSDDETSERIGRKLKRGGEILVRNGQGTEFINGPSYGVSLENIQLKGLEKGLLLARELEARLRIEGVRMSTERAA